MIAKCHRVALTGLLILSAICAALLPAGCGSLERPVTLTDVNDLYPSAVFLQPIDEPAQSSGDSLMAIRDDSGVVGYVAQRRLAARSGRFGIRVVMDRQPVVQRAEVTYYIGSRGGEIRSPEFTRQFIGKTPDDPIRIGVDVDAVTGATISSRTMADGVREIVDQVSRRVGR